MAMILGIEGGGTKTTAILMADTGRVYARAEAGPANASLHTAAQLAAVFRRILAGLPIQKPLREMSHVSLCLAGVIDPATTGKVREAARKVFPKQAALHIGSDLISGLYGAFGRGEGIVLIAGTGSCSFGMHRGRSAKSGGWGHLLGDRGSGYFIGLMALQEVIREQDHFNRLSPLGKLLLSATGCQRVSDLVTWSAGAEKARIAALAPEVFRAVRMRERSARRIIDGAVLELVADCQAVAKQLRWTKGARVALRGGLFDHHPDFTRQVSRLLHRHGLRVVGLTHATEGAKGAALWAREKSGNKVQEGSLQDEGETGRELPLVDISKISTEDSNPATARLSELSTAEAVKLMINEDRRILPALRRETAAIARTVDLIAASFKKGGRLFYVGAGTSGRLGVLDASECPPTFSVPPEMVQGIIAGGAAALTTAIEGAEDDREEGRSVMETRGINSRDIVVGLAASGRTPYVWGALEAAHQLRAKTVIVSCNPKFRGREPFKTTVAIHLATGPETLTGSTRLRAGTATKLVLNLFTTLAMTRIGKVLGNYMIDVAPTNEKLRARAIRLVCLLTGRDAAHAFDALCRNQWNVRAACEETLHGTSGHASLHLSSRYR